MRSLIASVFQEWFLVSNEIDPKKNAFATQDLLAKAIVMGSISISMRKRVSSNCFWILLIGAS